MSSKIDPDMILPITVDQFMDVLIVMNYLQLVGEGAKRQPSYYKVDTDYCVEKLQMVIDGIKKRHLENQQRGDTE